MIKQHGEVSKDTKDIISYIKEISKEKTVYTYGDKCLYRMCRESLKSKDVYEVASTIWLIGRSYAASPERQIKKSLDEQNKIKSEELFKVFADKIVNNIFNDQRMVENGEYKYNDDYIEKDARLLCDTVLLVQKLNMMRTKVSRVDGTENIISFCSKFLHFYMPKQVFIIDQYSLNGSIRILGKIHSQTKEKHVDKDFLVDDFRIKECQDNFSSIDRKVLDILTKENRINIKEDKVLEEYRKHICRCYALAMFLNKNDLTGIEIYNNLNSMPRLVDSILLKVGNIDVIEKVREGFICEGEID